MIEIIDATNLLGDSLYAINVIKPYLSHGNNDVYIVADPGLAYQMYQRTFGYGKLYNSMSELTAQLTRAGVSFNIRRLSAGDSGTICFRSAQEKNHQLHITEGYAELLGFQYAGSFKPDVPWVDTFPQTHEQIMLAPFSKSCSRHSGDRPNKTLDDWKWDNLLSFFRQQDQPIKIIGGPKDRLEKVKVGEEEYFSAKTFDELCQELRRASLLVTVDNGLGHLASVLDVPTIILWPVVSCIGFIAPLWANNTRYIQLEPNAATPAAIMMGLKPYVRDFLNKELNAPNAG